MKSPWVTRRQLNTWRNIARVQLRRYESIRGEIDRLNAELGKMHQVFKAEKIAREAAEAQLTDARAYAVNMRRNIGRFGTPTTHVLDDIIEILR